MQQGSDSDSIVLPSTFDDWDEWNRIAFQRANTQVFLKLGTWIMLRFRQLAGISLEDRIDGLVIPEHPASFEIEDDADYHEALGLHGLYSAIANMESYPQHLAHIFHELGKASAEGRIGNSHPRVRSVPEPPTPVQRYVDVPTYARTYSVCSTMLSDGLGWLCYRTADPYNETNDQDADFEVDDEDRDVSTALDEMDISGAPTSADPSDSLEAHKRKRTMSSTLSPPKVTSWVGRRSLMI
jgi:hypothetical protein